MRFPRLVLFALLLALPVQSVRAQDGEPVNAPSAIDPQWQPQIVPKGAAAPLILPSAGAAKALNDGRLQPTGDAPIETGGVADNPHVQAPTADTPPATGEPAPAGAATTTTTTPPAAPAGTEQTPTAAQPAATPAPAETPAPPATTTAPSPAQPAGTPVPTAPANGSPPAATAPAAQPATPETTAPAPTAPAQPATATPAPEITPLPEDIQKVITNSTATMDAAAKALADDETTQNNDLERWRQEIDDVISNTTRAADSLRPKLKEIKSQIDKLGPAPEAGQPAEAETAANERARLAAEQSQLSGAIKTLEVTWFRARQAIEKITKLRLELFVRNLTERMTKPFLNDLPARVARDWPSLSWRVGYNIDDWSRAIGRQLPSVSLLVVFALLTYLLLKTTALWLIRVRSRPDTKHTFFQRAFAASWITPIRAAPGAITAIILYLGLDNLGLLYYPTSSPAGWALLRSSLIFIAVGALLTTVFSPRHPERRLVQLSNRSAGRIARLLKALTLIYAIDIFLSEVGQVLYFPISISVLQSTATSLAFAAVLVGLLMTPFTPHDEVDETAASRFQPRWIKIPLFLAAMAILVVCLAGYVALGRFLSQQILMTGVVGLVGTLLYLAIRAFTRENNGERTLVSLFLENRLGFDGPRRRQLAGIVEYLLSGAVMLLLAPFLLMQWGFAAADIRHWFSSLFFGFQVGNIEISLFRILLGLALFIGLLFATRVVQRRLRTSLLSRPRFDPGIANSIDKAVGYVGILIATLLAVSYAGFDVTNLAIVAGALSVGIGFGLQSIVNNFVSGLILLIERPIKVGDWIKIGTEEGIVKNISVRSTEIETFNKASLIIPNSELVAGRVINMTHRNALGRIDLFFNAGVDEDPKQVIEILSRIADAHPDILREPEPIALFEGYTATATEYSLRFYLPDIGKGLRIRSDIRVSVYKAFRAANIEMPVTTSVKGGVVGPIAPE